MKKNYVKILMILLFVTSMGVQAQDYLSLLKQEITSQRSQLGIGSQDINELYIYSKSKTQKTDVMHVYAGQKYNDISIFNATVNGAFKGQELVYFSNTLEANISARVNTTTPQLNPLQAATAAAVELGLGSGSFSLIETVTTKEFLLTNGGVSLEDVPVELVYVPVDEDLKLAWDLNLHTLDGKHWWSVRIDAQTGEIINQNDWVVSCSFSTHNHQSINENNNSSKKNFSLFKTEESSAAFAGEQYNVYALPLESPNHGNASLVVDPQNLDASPFGWHDTDGAEGAEFTITRGNNVLAWDDILGDNEDTGGTSPDGGDALNFDFPYAFDTDPVNMLEASTTNLFYWNNIMHDVLFLYGFDEESGNFQQTNYSNLGIGNDFVIADSQDGSGLNNANFATPPDGNNPRMQMFLWTASGPPGEAVTILDGSLAGSYIGIPAGFGAPLPEETALQGELVILLDDNAGESTDELDGCDNVTNAADVAGKIALLRRGACEFGTKVLSAEQAGAIAVIVVNNVPDAPIGMAPGATGDQVTIPSVMVSQEDGEALISALQNGEVINGSLLNDGPFQIDGNLDNGIVAHEYGHGVSNRLTGGANNSNCMRTCVQFNADGCVPGRATEVMSEGWSDYFGLMLTMREGDTGEDLRGIGTYAIGQPTDGVGIRPTAYSTDFAINNSSYDSVAEFESTTAPHPVGYVWATMIWDMTWGFIDEFGFDADIYNGTGGNNIALQLVMDGLKLQPCNPGFVDGRDAILAAVEMSPYFTDEDTKATAGCIIWTAFAKRGLGFSADQGDWREREDGTSATDLPPDNLNPCLGPLSVERVAAAGVFSVFPNPSNGNINIAVNTPQGRGTVKIIDINGRVVYTKDAVLEGSLKLQAEGLAAGIYLLQVQSANATETIKIIIE
ncbi:putative secreted protein (Por secretion system target) [Dokdonia sp. Hel_I_63]|uniref:T9SS-dependent M36 family metallopeptidase n=1 Tax=Dokdonia sp. Hel_I_63 TaxID=1249996 RepID=UPI00119A0474|nr:T9SS-dependent M36 family metallopeptidase [Dokdonia sp. Hel_I_63]TVZ21267.1 putative secreted protein (Por secretion system target) [Dokdonia sp. Hel_I_63]